MVIDFKKYLSAEICDKLSFTVDLSDISFAQTFPFSEPANITAELKGLTASVEVTLNMVYSYAMPCDRCLAEQRVCETVTVRHELIRAYTEQDYDDRFIVVHGEKFDLSALAKDDILLAIPSKFLCKKSCKGICPRCGKNLNEGSCSCDTAVIDPRLEKLRELIK